MTLSRTDLTALALEAGFDFAGLAPAAPPPRAAPALRAWLARGGAAGLDWMARDPEVRMDPRRWDPAARAVLVAGVSYFTGDPPPAFWDDPARGRVARFAWGPDYHDVLERRLDALAERIRALAGAAAPGRVFVDRRPVLERGLAEAAGLGACGRHTQFIHPVFGAMVFLGGLTLAFEPGGEGEHPAPPDPCPAGCERCLRACPTGALAEVRHVAAARCVSCVTIEQARKEAPPAERPPTGRWLFGCDTCLEVCPRARPVAAPAAPRFLAFDPDLHAPRLEDVLAMEEDGFRRRYAGTAVARAGLRGLRRNAAAALGA